MIDRQTTTQVPLDEACASATEITYYATPGKTAACRTLCKDPSVTDCSLPAGFTVSTTPSLDDASVRSCTAPEAGATVAVTCLVTHGEGTWSSGCPVEGRRTDGVSTEDAPRAGIGHYFAHCAALEATAVVAFRRMVRELVALRAPSELVARAERALLDEIEHTAAVRDLAARYGAPMPNVLEGELPLRAAFEVALENAVEGRIRETFGAAIALHKSRHARELDTRVALAKIADEEREHAELAADLETWFATRLSPEELGTIASAKATAIQELRAAHEVETDPDLVVHAGLPLRAEALGMIEALEQLVWALPAAA